MYSFEVDGFGRDKVYMGNRTRTVFGIPLAFLK